MNELDIKYSENPKTLNAPLLTPNSKLIISNLNPSSNKSNHRYTGEAWVDKRPEGIGLSLNFSLFLSFVSRQKKEKASIIVEISNLLLTTYTLI
jgi:hypothetical protein